MVCFLRLLAKSRRVSSNSITNRLNETDDDGSAEVGVRPFSYLVYLFSLTCVAQECENDHDYCGVLCLLTYFPIFKP